MAATEPALIDRKFARRFQLLDVDGDGFVTAKDYELIIQRMLDAYRPDSDSPIASELRERFMRMWHGLKKAADADGDGKVTADEYVAAVKKGLVLRADGYDRVIKPAVQTVLRLADADNSGALSFQEYERLIGTMGVDQADARACFEAIDVNGDGQISVEEFLAADREFYVSDDPDATGNLLFGRL